MGVRFDAASAEALIQNMDAYCLSMQKNAIDLLDLLELSGEWQDPQALEFHKMIMAISKDLCDAMQLESEYMEVFKERVAELRG